MMIGDIVFMQGKSIVSKTIRLFDRGQYSHVAIAVTSEKVIEADVYKRVSISQIKISKYSKIECVSLDMSYGQRINIAHKAQEYLGVKYDYKQLLWYGLRKIFRLKGKNRLNNPNNLICSELVFIVLNELGILEDLGIRESVKYGEDLTPNELYDLVKYIVRCR